MSLYPPLTRRNVLRAVLIGAVWAALWLLSLTGQRWAIAVQAVGGGIYVYAACRMSWRSGRAEGLRLQQRRQRS